MKEHVFSLGKWLIVAGILAILGVLLVTGLGRRRGSRFYRWRLAMWSTLIALIGGGALLVTSCSSDKSPVVKCYTELGLDKKSEEDFLMCYIPDIGPPPETRAEPDADGLDE